MAKRRSFNHDLVEKFLRKDRGSVFVARPINPLIIKTNAINRDGVKEPISALITLGLANHG